MRKWGNSLAVRLPKAVAEAAGIKEDAAVYLAVENGTLRVTPMRPQPTLAELVSAISPRNVHEEAEFGGRKGREIW